MLDLISQKLFRSHPYHFCGNHYSFGISPSVYFAKIRFLLCCFSPLIAKNGFKLILWQRKSSGHGIFHTCFRCYDCSDLLLKRRKQAELCKGGSSFSPRRSSVSATDCKPVLPRTHFLCSVSNAVHLRYPEHLIGFLELFCHSLGCRHLACQLLHSLLCLLLDCQ